MSRDRIKEKFAAIKREGRPGLIVFLTTGFPDLEATLELVPALASAGADAIELSIPFSDPLADGPDIQESSFRALQRGVTPQDCLDTIAQARDQVPDTPLILMTYYNSVYNYGLERFAIQAEQSGVDGLIMIDLPGEEAEPLLAQCRPRNIHLIPLLAPTSTDASIHGAAEVGSGFIYCISVTGITGARDRVSQQGLQLLDRVSAHSSLPLAVGFGISRREHVETVCQQAQAAVVGSALIRTILDSPREQVVARASRFVAELAGRPWPAQEGVEQ